MNPLRAPAGVANPLVDPGTQGAQAQVNDPIPSYLKAPVQMGDQPSATSQTSVNQSAMKKNPVVRPMGLDAHLPERNVGMEDPANMDARAAWAQSKSDQESELSGLQDYINQLKSTPQDINWTPLAGFVDSLKGGDHYTKAAEAVAPMSADQRAKMIGDLQMKFLGGRAAMSRENAQALQAQIAQQAAERRAAETERFHTGLLQQGMARADAMGGRVLAQKDAQAQRAADVFDKDPIIKTQNDRYNQIMIDKHTLETSDVITPQIMAELSQGIATALSGGKSAGLGMTEKQELTNIQNDFAKLKQYSGTPTNALSPENRAMFLGLFDRLQKSYGNVIAARADQLRKGRNFSNNPGGNEVYDAKHAEYVGYRSTPKPSGQIKVSNGKETLMVDPADLVHAKADGYSEVK
jgi:hypothetical protein